MEQIYIPQGQVQSEAKPKLALELKLKGPMTFENFCSFGNSLVLKLGDF